MKRLWYFIFPLVFLPGMAESVRTNAGVIETGDIVIGPLLLLMWLAPGSRNRKLLRWVLPAAFLFLVWALVSTLSIPLPYRFPHDANQMPLTIGLLKIAKFTLYAAVGFLAASRLNTAAERRMWLWALLAGGLIISAALLRTVPQAGASPLPASEIYKSYNSITVAVGFLVVYLVGMLLEAHGTWAWRRCAALLTALLLFTLAFSASRYSHGRGGWFAIFFGILYLLYRKGTRLQAVVLAIVLVAGSVVAYQELPDLRYLVNDTFFNRDIQYNTIGFNDSAHLWSAAHEVRKMVDHPVLGTGFYHRGGSTGLWPTGPHNFFVAMLLETGVIGLALMLAAFWRFWHAAGTPVARLFRLDAPSRAVIVAGVVAGNAGEYFYGSVALLMFVSLLALTFSMPAEVVAAQAEAAGPALEEATVH